MIETIVGFITPIIMIIFGIWLKKGYLPNTKSEGKLWLWLIIIGTIGILFKLIKLFLY